MRYRLASLTLTVALILSASEANAARPLLAELLARAPVDAEGMFLQNQIDAELPMLGGYDEQGLNDFQHRLIRHEQLAKQFQAEFPLYQQKQKAYDAAVAEFDRDCAQGFTAGDLGAAKAKLGIK
jgi:alpha-D-ribose 1-methylphosphonate 5-triphosphate synthase subunit PhnI